MNILGTIHKYNYSLEDVAKALGITTNTLSRNINNNPTVKTLKKIADVIGCDVADFFEDEHKTISSFTIGDKTYYIVEKKGYKH